MRSTRAGTFTGYRCRKKLEKDWRARPRGVSRVGWRNIERQTLLLCTRAFRPPPGAKAVCGSRASRTAVSPLSVSATDHFQRMRHGQCSGWTAIDAQAAADARVFREQQRAL